MYEMRKDIQVSSYEEFERKVNEKKLEIENCYSEPLYRGHRKSSWDLETTLERCLKERCLNSSEYPYLYYFQKMKNVQKDIHKNFDKKWNLNKPSFREDTYQNSPSPEEYGFMAYLRHYGFPSPLLDWTSSMEVASFFAFQKSSEEKNVAIYVYFRFKKTQPHWHEIPTIFHPGPTDIEPNKRHKKQKSQYTIALKTINKTINKIKINNIKIICNHEEAFTNVRNHEIGLNKYLIPSKERDKVLKKLYKLDIDAFTLLQDEDSLMERLKNREFPGRSFF